MQFFNQNKRFLEIMLGSKIVPRIIKFDDVKYSNNFFVETNNDPNML